MTTINLEPGQVAVLLTPVEDRVTARVVMNSRGIDPQDIDGISQTMYLNCLARGMASLAITRTDDVFQVGMDHMKQDIGKAD
mgnify:CR=1 FL=1